MTTIAVRDGIMAADRTVQADGINVFETSKIYRVKGALIGFAGALTDALRFVLWYRDRRSKRPTFDDNGGFDAIVINPDGSMELWDQDLVPMIVESDYISIGSGNAVALGAMYQGASAEEALEAAAYFDTNTGYTIDVERL